MNIRNVIIVIALLLGVMLLAGCPNPEGLPLESQPYVYPEESSSASRDPAIPQEDPVMMDVERGPLSAEEQSWLADNLNRFAAHTAPDILALQEGENLLYSPAGLYIALSMLSEAADGETAEELTALLQPLEPGSQRGMTLALMENMRFFHQAGSQQVDNALLMSKEIEVDSQVLETLTSYYQADIHIVDDMDDGAVEDWIGEVVGDMPRQEEAGNAQLVILNAIQFDDVWSSPFLMEDAREDTFTLADGQEIQVPLMHKYATGTRFIQTDTYDAATLYFESYFRINLILPREGITPQQLLRDGVLGDTFVYRDNPNTVEGDVHFLVPRLEFENSLDLTEVMQQLGMPSAFKGGFSAIRGPLGALAVTAIYQNCTFTMDEEGAQAKAVTEIEMEETEAGEDPEEYVEPPLLELFLTRPFLFTITSEQGYTTFVGVVENPLA